MPDLSDADKEAIRELWFRKSLSLDAMFAHAEVAEDVVREDGTAKVGTKGLRHADQSVR